jgi:hypothetical protein
MASGGDKVEKSDIEKGPDLNVNTNSRHKQ